MSQNYLDIARQGKNNWWRYLIGILLIAFFWLIIGGIATAISLIAVAIFQGVFTLDSALLQQQLEEFLKTRSTINYVIHNIGFIFFLVGIFLTVKLLHGRKFLSLVNPEGKISSIRFFTGFGIWFLMGVLVTGLGILLEPENIEFAFQPVQWFSLVACALILTPIQTSTEELFFRGYAIQGLSLITKQPFLLIVFSGLLFMFPHLSNPEVERGAIWLALYYFSFGVFCSLITIKDNRLELALGIHAANNLFHIFISTRDSALPVPSIWFIKQPGDPKWTLMWFLGECAIFYLIVFGLGQRKKLQSNRTAESQETEEVTSHK
ncbi:MAG: lysostaphin resistance A-like protein [Mastigocoleus sp.]